MFADAIRVPRAQINYVVRFGMDGFRCRRNPCTTCADYTLLNAIFPRSKHRTMQSVYHVRRLHVHKNSHYFLYLDATRVPRAQITLSNVHSKFTIFVMQSVYHVRR